MAEAFMAQYSYNTQIEPKRAFTRNSNATTSGSAVARPSDVGMVTTTPKTANPFANTSNTTSQTSSHQPRGQRVFTPLYMSLSKALGVLIKKGHLKPLEPHPLPDPLPPKHNLAKYYHGHDIDLCFRLCHEIQDLIDNKVIAPPQKPSVTTNPLPLHNQVHPPRRMNLIQTLAIPYDPSRYFTHSHLPKPTLFIPESTDLCMMNASTSQPEPVVVMMVEEGRLALKDHGNVSSVPEGFVDLSEGEYNMCRYIVPTNQATPDSRVA
ncbi:hypothetical protein HYC85_029286 [Camellia sinensis]|uniref:Uncharacterized protein n=1 Tax=Camellia sinensis TaxID=4442 RepID=A0A7J7FXP5_CAMSI|nr:hypothetical protein HYC85_029286 [Camellia sinensis]